MVSHRVRRARREHINHVLSFENTSLLCDLCGIRVSFFSRHANLKVGVPKVFPSRSQESLLCDLCGIRVSFFQDMPT